MPVTNRIRCAYQSGLPSFGIYVSNASPRSVEWLGAAGLDFLRIDMDGSDFDLETIRNMIYAAHAVGITPIVRIPGVDSSVENQRIIHGLIHMGALGVIVPHVRCRADVERAVDAVKLPPLGSRRPAQNIYLEDKPEGYDGTDNDWINENILLSIQAETKTAVETIEEIVRVPGLDMIQSGRNDLSYEYEVPGLQYHPIVLEAERKVVQAGLDAGKMTSVQYYPLRDPTEVEVIRDRIKLGVNCISLGSDKDIIHVIRSLLNSLSQEP